MTANELDNDIAAALARRLTTFESVTQICGTRIYPEILPQGCELPAIAYSLVSEQSEAHLTGPASIATARVQFDCFANTSIASKQLKNEVRKALHASDHFAQNGVSVRDVQHENTYTQYVADPNGADSGKWVSIVDFNTVFEETN